MASLDFIGDSTKAYAFIWHNRLYLLQNAIPVFFVKVVCILTVMVSNTNSNIMREGLLLLPSYAVEAFFLMNLIRFCLYAEPIFIWGKQIPVPIQSQTEEKKFAPYLTRNSSLQAGVAIFLLIKVLLGVVVGYLSTLNLSQNPTLATPSFINALLSLALLGGFFWSIRLFWLYVPAAAGYSVVTFLDKIKGMPSSLYFFGVFIISFFPLILAYAFLSQFLPVLFGATAITIILDSILQAFFVVTITSIQAVAIGFGVWAIMNETPKK